MQTRILPCPECNGPSAHSMGFDTEELEATWNKLMQMFACDRCEVRAFEQIRASEPTFKLAWPPLKRQEWIEIELGANVAMELQSEWEIGPKEYHREMIRKALESRND